MSLLALAALGARIVLAGVFLAAATAKLSDRAGTRKAMTGFGVPRRASGAFALAIPFAELIVAALLLPAGTAHYGAIGSIPLLTLFSAAIAWNLAHGRAPECHCFGHLHSAPASWRTLARNGALLGLAAVAVAGSATQETTSAVAWIGDLSGSEVALLAVGAAAAVVLALGSAAFLSLMRSYGVVLTRLDRVEAALARAGLDLEQDVAMPELGLEPGTPAPAFAAATPNGGELTLETLTGLGIPTLMLFTSPHCGPCTALLPVVAEWQRERADQLSIVVASAGSPEEARAEADENELENVVVDTDGRIAELFEANGTPSAVLIAPDGTIDSRVASGGEWIEQLVEQALGGTEGDGLAVGSEAPALELPSLDGEPVSLASLRGRQTLLLFWNPDCGYCRSMRDDLRAWEASANGVTPRLVVVSSGDEEGTRAEGFESLVLLDEGLAAGAAFGVNGTPMAVLLDSEGRIASPVAVGAEAVLELAREPARR